LARRRFRPSQAKVLLQLQTQGRSRLLQTPVPPVHEKLPHPWPQGEVHPRKQGSPTPFAAEVLFGLLEAALSRVDWEVKVTGPDRRKARKGEGAFPF
jgi:hypothetical protein